MAVLLKEWADWADEISFRGYEVITEKELELRKKIYEILESGKFYKECDDGEFSFNVCWGTNEDDDYYLDDLTDSVCGETIPDDEANIIIKHLSRSIGETPRVWDCAMNEILRNKEDYKDELVKLVEEWVRI